MKKKAVFGKHKFTIGIKKWNIFQMRDVCPNLKEWKVQELNIRRNEGEPILKHIATICFS